MNEGPLVGDTAVDKVDLPLWGSCYSGEMISEPVSRVWTLESTLDKMCRGIWLQVQEDEY